MKNLLACCCIRTPDILISDFHFIFNPIENTSCAPACTQLSYNAIDAGRLHVQLPSVLKNQYIYYIDFMGILA